jgi:hypothetical protein
MPYYVKEKENENEENQERHISHNVERENLVKGSE